MQEAASVANGVVQRGMGNDLRPVKSGGLSGALANRGPAPRGDPLADPREQGNGDNFAPRGVPCVSFPRHAS